MDMSLVRHDGHELQPRPELVLYPGSWDYFDGCPGEFHSSRILPVPSIKSAKVY
jgi:hypothetical protein